MASPIGAEAWDGIAEEKRWREMVEAVRSGMDRSSQKTDGALLGFHVLCLAELDAASHFTRPECFVTRAAFVAELRRLIAEPTTPSRTVSSVRAYNDSQKWWLEWIVKQYNKGN